MYVVISGLIEENLLLTSMLTNTKSVFTISTNWSNIRLKKSRFKIWNSHVIFLVEFLNGVNPVVGLINFELATMNIQKL